MIYLSQQGNHYTPKESQPENQSCRSKINHWFILIGGIVKSFHKVDLIVFCKALYRVHTSLCVF